MSRVCHRQVFTIVGNRLQSDISCFLDYSFSSIRQPARVQEKKYISKYFFSVFNLASTTLFPIGSLSGNRVFQISKERKIGLKKWLVLEIRGKISD